MTENEVIEYEVGAVIEGEVTHIAKFGAFIRFDDNKEGLIHISEIANEFVTDINQHVQQGQRISVKIIGKNKEGKLELSLKRLQEVKKEPALFIHQKSKNNDFEDKMSMFLKKSEEKQVDIRRNLKIKQGVAKKR